MLENPPILPGLTLASDLERRALEVPDRPALFHDDGRSWTFAELDRRAERIAAALAGLGIAQGTRVAMYLRNGPELALSMLGAWKLNAVPVTVSGLYNGRELAESLQKSHAVLLLADDHDPEAVAGAAGTGVQIRLVAGDVASFEQLPETDAPAPPPTQAGQDDEAAILFTGGTTGKPKAVSVTYGGISSSLARLARVSKGRPGPYPAAKEGTSPNLVALPLFHGGGQHTLLFSFHVGRSAVLMERFHVDTLRRLVEEHRFDNLFLLPTMLYDVVHSPDPVDLSSVRSVLVAGQALSIHLRRQFEERFRIPILMNYGSTETGHVAGWTADDMRQGRWKPGSAGRIYDDVDVEIRDDDGHALPRGETGEVAVRSSMPREYVDDPESSSELVRDGWVHSGDIGYIDEDGVLFLVGRKRDMIKCGGFQVWPEEIEEELRMHPLVRDARVLGVPDERLGELPRAVVVREPDAAVDDETLTAQLIALCRERLAHFKAPREVVYVAELPRSEAGKVKRDALSAALVEEQS